MIIPPEPSSGIAIKPWLRQLYRYCRSLELRGDGKTCRVTRSDGGTTISCIPPESSASGGFAAADGYHNYFKVIIDPEDSEKIKVVDGGNPENEHCGFCDLYPVNLVPVTTLPLQKNNQVWLVGRYDPEDGFSVSIEYKSEVITGSYGYFVLADITARGDLIQRWTNGFAYFGDRYFI